MRTKGHPRILERQACEAEVSPHRLGLLGWPGGHQRLLLQGLPLTPHVERAQPVRHAEQRPRRRGAAQPRGKPGGQSLPRLPRPAPAEAPESRVLERGSVRRGRPCVRTWWCGPRLQTGREGSSHARGRGRRGRPPSRTTGTGETAVPGPLGTEDISPSMWPDDKSFARVMPRAPASSRRADTGAGALRRRDSPETPFQTAAGPSDGLDASSPGNSFVGLRAVAKWPSNGYFYSGKVTQDVGTGKCTLLFDDGYGCAALGRDILGAGPPPGHGRGRPSEDECLSAGAVKGNRRESERCSSSEKEAGGSGESGWLSSCPWSKETDRESSMAWAHRRR